MDPVTTSVIIALVTSLVTSLIPRIFIRFTSRRKGEQLEIKAQDGSVIKLSQDFSNAELKHIVEFLQKHQTPKSKAAVDTSE